MTGIVHLQQKAPPMQGQPAPAAAEDAPAALSPLKLTGLALGPLLGLIAFFVPAPAGMPPEAWRMTGVALWMVVWWLTEAAPIPATALLPVVLMPLAGLGEMRAVAAGYADPLIFLFLGGFLLAGAVQNVGLHRRIALHIVAAIGTTPGRIVLGFMLATAFLSMWISNTAASIMMYTVGLSVIDFVRRAAPDTGTVRPFGVALMLGIAYAASIGGVGTLIGTPPNALLASFVGNTYGIEVSFFSWMLIGLPVVAVLLPVAWLMLARVMFATQRLDLGDPGALLRGELRALGPMSPGERLVGLVFLAAAAGWVLRRPLASATGLPLNDSMVALLAALVLFAVPVSRRTGQYALTWEVAKTIPWNVLILFGGGLALAGGFSSTGLAGWIGEQVAGARISTAALVVLVLVAIAYLSEVTSNTASTATFLPILGAVAVGLALDPLTLTVPVALGASMAFMMPVATPPNAIVFSYEQMRLSDIVRAGFWLKILGILTVLAVFALLGGPVLGIGAR